jgi:hypothetical protein
MAKGKMVKIGEVYVKASNISEIYQANSVGNRLMCLNGKILNPYCFTVGIDKNKQIISWYYESFELCEEARTALAEEVEEAS